MPEQRVNILVYRPDSTLVAQYLLGDGEHLIGRDINCPIYLDSEYISSNHAKLHLSYDGILIEDLNSTSGTFLDGVTVRGKLRIKPGQVLQVGDLTVQLQPESEGQIGPGSRLGDGRYTLIRMLGRGGMGEVWLAKDEQLDEEVALKKLPPEVGADAMALADMRREVQKSRALSHPNIIRIHDLIQKSGEDPLISLEFVDGTDLTAIAATKTNGIFGWTEIKDWMLQLANALEYAHEEKIVHRDLKPGNIMISRNGRLKLADFGIAATLVDSLSRSSMQGFVSGTTLYMSPQQMEGATPKATDDVYAFGTTLYELLTSRPPFYTGNVEHQVLQVTPTPPSQRLAEFGFVGEIPPYVNELVMACLAKVPEGRPQSMGAIRDWIQSEGKAEGAIPKPSTKTIKMRAPVAAEVPGSGDEAAVGEGKGRSGMPAWMIFVMGAVLILICFIVGKKMSDGKEVDPAGDNNGSAVLLPESLKEGLVAYYPFNGNAKDESGNGNDGEVQGATLGEDRNGHANQACNFDGLDDQIDVPSTSGVEIQSNLTHSFWANPGHATRRPGEGTSGVFPDSSRGVSAVIESRTTSSTFAGACIALGTDGLVVYEHASNHMPATLVYSADLTGWKHYGIVYENNRAKLYISGVLARQGLQSSRQLFFAKDFGDDNWEIADFGKGGWGEYKGKLDDIRIYNRALSEAEVKALYEFEKVN